jgi:hypothetical protein
MRQWTVRGFRIEEKKAQALARRLQAASARHQTHAEYPHFARHFSRLFKVSKKCNVHLTSFKYIFLLNTQYLR